MGKEWDHDKGGRNEWVKWMSEVMIEVKRVLKPGAHCFVWALPRTSHWTATALEDAGFEIRDIVTHVFGSGFPKSHNISKAIDKMKGVEGVVVGKTRGTYPDTVSESVIYNTSWSNSNGEKLERKQLDITTPASKEAKQWEGWGTALKPASEHWILCRKPLSEKTVADNVLKWGTGGINIDGSRIEYKDDKDKTPVYTERINFNNTKSGDKSFYENAWFDKDYIVLKNNQQGRFPANFIHDGSDEVMEEFDKAGYSKSNKLGKTTTKNNVDNFWFRKSYEEEYRLGYGDEGSAARFFYCSKSSTNEKNAGLQKIIKINLLPTNYYIYDKKQSYILWETEELKVVLQVDMDRSTKKDIEELELKENKLWSIDIFMNYIMDQFQKECSSIIKTGINSTTLLKILNSWMLQHINAFIQIANFSGWMDGGKLVENVEKQNMKQSSIQREKDGLEDLVKNVDVNTLWNIRESNGNIHPTTKSIKLMSYLINMITPPNGIVIDPFMGSGSTGVAAVKAGYNFIGIEKEKDYMEIAKKRIENVK